MDETFRDDRWCVGCGEHNPRGFRLAFRYEGEKLRSEALTSKEHQGFANVVHGGVLGLLLDEMLVNLYWLKGVKVVTVEYRVRLRRPCPVGRRLLLSAWPTGGKRTLRLARAEARLEDGALVAEAEAKCMLLKPPSMS